MIDLIQMFEAKGWRVGVNNHNDIVFKDTNSLGWFSIGGATSREINYLYG